jgi:hypothetical protein
MNFARIATGDDPRWLILRAVDEREPGNDPSPTPYRQAEPPARFFKSVLQMVIGVATLIAMAVQLARGWSEGRTIVQTHQQVLELMGLALILAAAVQLLYCLYVPGPGEVLDPLALGIAAALLFQLAKVQALDAQQAAAAILYVVALGGLLAIRGSLVKVCRHKDWTIRDGWEQVRQWRESRQRAWRRGSARIRTKVGRHVAVTSPTREQPTIPTVATIPTVEPDRPAEATVG